jgi:hypothetical protein
LLAAACGGGDHQEAVAAPAAPPKADPIAKGVPHGGHIAQVAITDNADAALTLDNTGGVRLWPALDGSRTPVPVSVMAPAQLALAHAGRDLLAAFLDEAGSVRLMRLGRDGSVRGDVQLPADVAVEQVIAIDDAAIVRREDHSIEWFSTTGELRGRVVAEPASRIQMLAARGEHTVAIVTDGTTTEMRWLTLHAGKLTWDTKYTLPADVSGELFAVSPSNRRIAFVDSHRTLAVYDLGLVPTRVGDTASASDAFDMGFVDDDHVALVGSRVQWWAKPAKPPKDPWEVTPFPTPSTAMGGHGGAVSDKGAVMGFGAALSITDMYAVRYLGYREHGAANMGAAGSSLWLSTSNSHFVWLDDKLAIKREIELRPQESGAWIYATPISDRHVVTQVALEGKYKLELVDLDKRDQPIPIGTYPSVERIELAPETGILAVSSAQQIHRFKVDLTTNAITPMPALKVRGSIAAMRVFDPATSGGITAITLGWRNDYDELYTLTVYRENGKPKQIRSFAGRLIDIDERAMMHVVDGNEIQTRHGETKVASFKLDHVGAVTAVTADGARFATVVNNDVIVVDNTGAEQWRKPLWGAQQLTFTRDGKRLAIRANGGIVLLDAKTGARTSMECGWSFSLMTKPPQTNALAAAPVCEDPML